MAQLKDTTIQGNLHLKGEGVKIYVNDTEFQGGGSGESTLTPEQIEAMGFIKQDTLNGYVTNNKIGGDNLGLVKNGGNVIINPDGTMKAPTSGGTVDGYGNAWYKGDVYVGGTSPDDGKRLATENYVNEQKPIFIATYGKTTYEEVAEAYYSGKQLYLNINKDDKNLELTNKATKCIASLLRVDGSDRDKSAFTFVCDENGVSHKYSIDHSTKVWSNSHSKWAMTIDYLSKEMSRAQGDISKLLPLLASSFNSFRGEYKETAGTLEVNAPGIYLVLQGGSGNKTLTILQNGKEVYKSPECNGWIVLSSDTGVVTPIGIKSGIAALAGSFETPGTYVGWIPGQTTDFTRITYPANCVIWYLGSSNNDIRTW